MPSHRAPTSQVETLWSHVVPIASSNRDRRRAGVCTMRTASNSAWAPRSDAMFSKRVVRMLDAQGTAGAFTTVDPAKTSAANARVRARPYTSCASSCVLERGLGDSDARRGEMRSPSSAAMSSDQIWFPPTACFWQLSGADYPSAASRLRRAAASK